MGPERIAVLDTARYHGGAQEALVRFLIAAEPYEGLVVSSASRSTVDVLRAHGVAARHLAVQTSLGEQLQRKSAGVEAFHSLPRERKHIQKATAGYKVIVCNGAEAAAWAFVAKCRSPLLYYAHDILRRSIVRDLLWARVFQGFSSAAANSAVTARSVNRFFSDVSVIRPGVAERMYRDESSRLELVANPAAPFVVVARLDPWKGVACAVEAYSHYQRRGGARPLHIYPGVSRQPGELSVLGDAIASLPEPQRVRIQPPTDARAIFENAAALIHLPRLPEPAGMVIGEAFASRVPVVTVRSGGPGEQGAEGRATLVGPDDSAAAIGARMIELELPAFRTKLRRQIDLAFGFARTVLDPQRAARQYREWLAAWDNS